MFSFAFFLGSESIDDRGERGRRDEAGPSSCPPPCARCGIAVCERVDLGWPWLLLVLERGVGEMRGGGIDMRTTCFLACLVFGRRARSEMRRLLPLAPFFLLHRQAPGPGTHKEGFISPQTDLRDINDRDRG